MYSGESGFGIICESKLKRLLFFFRHHERFLESPAAAAAAAAAVVVRSRRLPTFGSCLTLKTPVHFQPTGLPSPGSF